MLLSLLQFDMSEFSLPLRESVDAYMEALPVFLIELVFFLFCLFFQVELSGNALPHALALLLFLLFKVKQKPWLSSQKSSVASVAPPLSRIKTSVAILFIKNQATPKNQLNCLRNGLFLKLMKVFLL